MTHDPRVCRDPFPFDHLSIAEVGRHEVLEGKYRRGSLTRDERAELISLARRRYWAPAPLVAEEPSRA